MITLRCPVKQTVWGKITNIKELNYAIAKSGQPFGVDMSGPACAVNPAWPCAITYYQHLGFGLHQGVDIPVATGMEIYAATDGKVCEISDDTTKGIGIVLYDATQSIKTVYWHLQSHSVGLSDTIKAGQLIGISDNTGYSLGPHLHFELKTTDIHGLSIKSIDPMPYISFEPIMETMTNEFVNNFYLLFFGRKPEADETDYWQGKDYRKLFQVALAGRAENYTANQE